MNGLKILVSIAMLLGFLAQASAETHKKNEQETGYNRLDPNIGAANHTKDGASADDYTDPRLNGSHCACYKSSVALTNKTSPQGGSGTPGADSESTKGMDSKNGP